MYNNNQAISQSQSIYVKLEKILFLFLVHSLISLIIFCVLYEYIKNHIYFYSKGLFIIQEFVFFIQIYMLIYKIPNTQNVMINALENSQNVINTLENVQQNPIEINIYNIKTTKLKIIKIKLKEIHKLESNNETCSICMYRKNKLKLNCSKNGYHGGCLVCIAHWTRKKNTCHECRAKIINFDE
jgi:hypothetical protein